MTNALSILFQATFSSIPVFVIFIPAAIYAYALRSRSAPPFKYSWALIGSGLGVPLIASVIGSAFYDTRNELIFSALKSLMVVDIAIFAAALLVSRGMRLLVATIAIPTLWFLFFVIFAAGLSIFNTWL